MLASKSHKKERIGIDPIIFYGSLIVLFLFTVPLIAFSQESSLILSEVKVYIEDMFGSVYQILAFGVLLYVLWLAFSQYGVIKLGHDDYHFGTGSWASMLFCAGVATGILYWATIEWAYYITDPPFGLAPGSDKAIEYASIYGMFHWGGVGWAFYSLPAVAIGYTYYVKQVPLMRISRSCAPVLGRFAEGRWGSVIDILFMVGLLGSTGTSMGLGTPMIAAGLESIWGVESSMMVKVIVIFVCTIIFSISVYLGLGNGIRRLSNLNTSLAFVFLTFVLLFGPTVFILKMGLNGFGLMVSEFVRMMTWTDPMTDSRFVEDWTVFYWAWWVAVGPFMGIFIAKISGGRTIKQVILGTIFFGSIGCAFFYIVLGNYALHLELNSVVSTTQWITSGRPEMAIPAVIMQLPLGEVAVIVFCIMSVIFMATSFDSTSYTLASCASNELPSDQEPARWHRLFWAYALIILPIALMSIGGLESLKIATLISALPLIGVYIIMGYSLYKNLADHPL